MMDPFSTLGVEVRFDLDEKELADKQRRLSLSLHPDRFAGRPANERRAALGKAIEVNEAYRTLKNPVSRATALLDRLGLTPPEGSEPPASPELLMEMMERREALREAGASGDVSKIERLSGEVRQLEEIASTKLAESLAQLLADPATDPGPALTQLGTLRYFRRFFDEAEALLDELS